MKLAGNVDNTLAAQFAEYLHSVNSHHLYQFILDVQQFQTLPFAERNRQAQHIWQVCVDESCTNATRLILKMISSFWTPTPKKLYNKTSTVVTIPFLFVLLKKLNSNCTKPTTPSSFCLPSLDKTPKPESKTLCLAKITSWGKLPFFCYH